MRLGGHLAQQGAPVALRSKRCLEAWLAGLAGLAGRARGPSLESVA